jgi:hypothetical protein
LFKDLRARLDNPEVGLGYLTDNNVLRYCKSYLWNTDLAFTKLCDGEKWRKDNDCFEVYPREVINEMNMKVGNLKVLLLTQNSSFRFMGMTNSGGPWYGSAAETSSLGTLVRRKPKSS